MPVAMTCLLVLTNDGAKMATTDQSQAKEHLIRFVLVYSCSTKSICVTSLTRPMICRIYVLSIFFPKITFITGVQADVSIWRYEVSRDVNKVASKVGHNELSKWPPLIGQ